LDRDDGDRERALGVGLRGLDLAGHPVRFRDRSHQERAQRRVCLAEAREQLFERFYRGPEARAAGPGYGLGLPLARHIARLHGGDVVCAGGDGVDARFVLEAPAWRPVSA